MNFREFYERGEPESYRFVDYEIVNMYASNSMAVREIATRTNRSIGEVYRILRRNQIEPNRRKTNHHNVISLADSGLPNQVIADFTGYTSRHVRNILNKRK
ncbi:MAG: hypothetical protein ACW99G_01230 [Candidatus Thorarchaeota archaeon]|jgi:hypothetical protein